MHHLTIIAVFAALFLAGCDSGSSTGPAPVTFNPGPAPTGQGFVALYAPPIDVGPYPNDIYNPTGAKLDVPQRVTSPLSAALNTLDGFSTTAVITAPFNAPIDPATLVPFNPLAASTGTESLFVLDATHAVPLVPGVHYEARISAAAGSGDSIVEIVPLQPLQPRTRYVFIMTDRILNTAGVAAAADPVFGAVRNAHLGGLTSVPGAPQLDPLFPAIGPLVTAATDVFGLPGNTVVAAWSMLTQSITDVLDVIEQTATARPAVLVSAGITTAQLGVGLPGIADVYAGYIEIPYFGDPVNPLDSFWMTAGLMPPDGTDPVAIARVPNQRIPLLATLPNAASGRTQPAAGWPVAIFQHGITLNRTVMFAVADSFAQAGFAVVAIDLPLHGVTNTVSPLYQGAGTAFGNNERHFNRDSVGATGVFAPDGQIDNGWQIMNLQNPVNARDHVRQAVADTIHLTRTIPALSFPDGDPNPDLDGSRIHFVGSSLGSIISGVFLGLNTEVGSATLASPAGPWTSILTDPEAVDFGAPIRAALSAQGLPPGTIGFDNFVRDLQTLLDPADPINYAAAASDNHALHVIEILGDTSVPNGPTDYITSLWGLPSISSSVAVTSPATTSGIVRFNAGGHSSLFNPAIDAAVTTEMQRQTVVFAASQGSIIQITDASVVD